MNTSLKHWFKGLFLCCLIKLGQEWKSSVRLLVIHVTWLSTYSLVSLCQLALSSKSVRDKQDSSLLDVVDKTHQIPSSPSGPQGYPRRLCLFTTLNTLGHTTHVIIFVLCKYLSNNSSVSFQTQLIFKVNICFTRKWNIWTCTAYNHLNIPLRNVQVNYGYTDYSHLLTSAQIPLFWKALDIWL